jgi:putative nucleotidyltransferase with HDIG domain
MSFMTAQMLAQPIDISKSLRQADQLPVYSLTSQRALKLINQPNASVVELAQTIGADQSLASKLLRMVNSAAFALPRKINKISEAVAYLGLEETRKVILAASAHALFGGTQSHEIWQHALTTAHIAESLCHVAKFGLDPDDAFLAGLLHDIGKTFMQKKFPSAYQSVLQQTESGISLPEAETAVFGLDHAQVGSEMLLHWNFPQNVRMAVYSHHSFQEVTDPVGLMVALANQLAHWGEDASSGQLDSRAMAFFGLDEPKVIDLKESVSLSIAQFEQRIGAIY